MTLIFPEIFEKEPIIAFFTGKEPGVDPERVGRLGRIDKRSIYNPRQEHTSEVIILESDLTAKVADAVLTERDGLMLGIHVADCVPILLYDRNKKVIGAVHAGWRGTALGILIKTIERMKEAFSSNPSDILIAIGPAIRRCCYEVGQDVYEGVARVTGKGDYILERKGRYYLDLPMANKHQALRRGVPLENIWMSDLCTRCNHDMFYSYRFSRDGGRQGGFIVIE